MDLNAIAVSAFTSQVKLATGTGHVGPTLKHEWKPEQQTGNMEENTVKNVMENMWKIMDTMNMEENTVENMVENIGEVRPAAKNR